MEGGGLGQRLETHVKEALPWCREGGGRMNQSEYGVFVSGAESQTGDTRLETRRLEPRDWRHERLKGGSLAMLKGFRQTQETHVERLPESPRATVACQANPAEPEWEDHVRRGAKRMVSI